MLLKDLEKLKVGDEVIYKVREYDKFISEGYVLNITGCNLCKNEKCTSISKNYNGKKCIGSIEIRRENMRTLLRCGVENGWSLISKSEEFITEEEFMI